MSANPERIEIDKPLFSFLLALHADSYAQGQVAALRDALDAEPGRLEDLKAKCDAAGGVANFLEGFQEQIAAQVIERVAPNRDLSDSFRASWQWALDEILRGHDETTH